MKGKKKKGVIKRKNMRYQEKRSYEDDDDET